MTGLLYVSSFLSLLFAGATFGFFYAWGCSTMWGLDAVDPVVAIKAMQSINASVRNAVFATAFFGTPVVLAVSAIIARAKQRQGASRAFIFAALIYAGGTLLPTVLFNAPMNEALAAVESTNLPDVAERVWRNFSDPWQFWNHVRTAGCAATLAFVGAALIQLRGRLA